MPDEPDARFREQLLQEVASWRRQGMVGDRAYRRILDHYGVAAGPDTSKRFNRLALILGTLGGLLVGIGVILLVASNWEGVPRLAKVGVMTSAMAASLAAAYWARYKRDNALLAGALLLLATLVYGAAIFVVGQAYHVPAGDPRLLLLWGTGAIAMGYAVVAKGPLIVGILAAGGWLIELVGESSESFSITMLTALMIGVAFLSTGEIHRRLEKLRPLAGTYVITGLIVIFLAALFLSFSEIWDFFRVPPSLGSLFWIVAVLALGTIGAAGYLWRDSRPMLIEAGGAAILVAASVLAGLVNPTRDISSAFFGQSGSLFHPLLFNAILLLGALWSIYVGLETDRDGFVNTALVFVGLLILARYFDFSFGLFDRSVVFIGAGIVLLGTAVGLDRIRRRLTADDTSPGRAT